MDWQFDEDNPMTRGFQHLHIPVDDVEDENLLRWFPQSNAFIHKGLSAQPPNESLRKEPSLEADGAAAENGVFIHWYVRFTSLTIAYASSLSPGSFCTQPSIRLITRVQRVDERSASPGKTSLLALSYMLGRLF